jgi:hypothetical protein
MVLPVVLLEDLLEVEELELPLLLDRLLRASTFRMIWSDRVRSSPLPSPLSFALLACFDQLLIFSSLPSLIFSPYLSVLPPPFTLLSPTSLVIGKAGSKINEIRAQSATQIRIMEPGQPGASTNPDERLVTITGQPAGINMAIQLLYQRLEAEKQARANAI